LHPDEHYQNEHHRSRPIFGSNKSIPSQLFIAVYLILGEIKFDLLIDIHTIKPKRPLIFEMQCFYGQLHHIFMVKLPAHPLFESVPTTRLLAVVQRCDTGGADVTLEYVTYTTMRPQMEVIELAAISCVVSHVKIGVGKWWGIIDRSKGLVCPTFIDDTDGYVES
jgi:hypothetical protein